MFIPLSLFDALHLALQLLIAVLLNSDLLGDLFAVGCVQLLDKLGHEVLVLERFLDSGQRGPCSLPLLGIFPILDVTATALLDLDFSPQSLQIEAAQRIRTQTTAVEELVASDVRVGLQQL